MRTGPPLHRILFCMLASSALFACSVEPAATPATPDRPPVAPAAVGEPAPRPVHDLSRIVSLGGNVTELLFALDLGPNIVGVDLSSTWPAGTKSLPSLGYFRRVPAEGVLSLRPTLVISTTEMGPPETVEQLRSANVPMLQLDAAQTVEGARSRIRAAAMAVGRVDRGEALVAHLDSQLARAADLVRSVKSRPRVLCIYSRGPGMVMVAGTGTGPDEMIRLAGAENAVTAFSGFRPLTPEAVLAAAPDVVLMPTAGARSLGGDTGLRALPGMSALFETRAPRVVHQDDLLLLGFGPRLGEAVIELLGLLHPELSGAAAQSGVAGSAR